jgi:hypothetical protein
VNAYVITVADADGASGADGPTRKVHSGGIPRKGGAS